MKLFGKRRKSNSPKARAIKGTNNATQIAAKRDVQFSQSGSYRLHSRCKTDMAAEAELAAFLDEYFYAPLLAEGRFVSIQRIQDKETQLRGIDVVLSTSKSTVNIDEKAQLYYVNKNLPTFAFELQILKNGREIEGWFINDDLQTDFYLLIWPQADTSSVYELTKDKFTCVEALMISKNKIRSYLEQLGLGKSALIKKAVELRNNQHFGKHLTAYEGVYFFLSDAKKYVEAPINIVIRKSLLIELAQAHYKVTPEGFCRI